MAAHSLVKLYRQASTFKWKSMTNGRVHLHCNTELTSHKLNSLEKKKYGLVCHILSIFPKTLQTVPEVNAWQTKFDTFYLVSIGILVTVQFRLKNFLTWTKRLKTASAAECGVQTILQGRARFRKETILQVSYIYVWILSCDWEDIVNQPIGSIY